MVAEPSRSAGINWGTQGTEPNVIVHDLFPHMKLDSSSRLCTLDESLATFLATPDKADDMPQDSVTADEGIVKMLWRIRAVVNNFGFSFKDIVDEQNKSTSCLNNSLRSISDWANKIEERIGNIESRGLNLFRK